MSFQTLWTVCRLVINQNIAKFRFYTHRNVDLIRSKLLSLSFGIRSKLKRFDKRSQSDKIRNLYRSLSRSSVSKMTECKVGSSFDSQEIIFSNFQRPNVWLEPL